MQLTFGDAEYHGLLPATRPDASNPCVKHCEQCCRSSAGVSNRQPAAEAARSATPPMPAGAECNGC